MALLLKGLFYWNNGGHNMAQETHEVLQHVLVDSWPFFPLLPLFSHTVSYLQRENIRDCATYIQVHLLSFSKDLLWLSFFLQLFKVI